MGKKQVVTVWRLRKTKNSKTAIKDSFSKKVIREKNKRSSFFGKSTYKSSNKKVVTVTKKGVMTAVALGEAKITVKYKEKKKVYKVTVIPEKKSDIRLEQDVVFTDETVPLKLVSDKYDTSQVKLKATEYDWLKLDKNAVLNVCSHSELTNANVELQYGSYKFKLRVFRIPPTIAFERVNARHWTDPEFLGDRSEITSDGIWQ